MRRLRDTGGTVLFRTIQWSSVQLGRFSPRVQTRIVRAVQLAAEVHVKSAEDDVSVHAAALTYNCFLSMLPLALVGVSLASLIHEPDPSQWTGRLLETVPGLAPLVQEHMAAVESSRTSLSVIGLIGALWVGSTLTSRAQRELDTIFGGRQNFVICGPSVSFLLNRSDWRWTNRVTCWWSPETGPWFHSVQIAKKMSLHI